MWRAFLNRLPTKTTLIKRNIHVENDVCAWCEEGEESIDHIITGCSVSAGVWHSISVWCRIPEIYDFSVKDVAVLHEFCAADGHKKSLLQGIFIIASWRLWRARNEKLFSRTNSTVADIVADVKSFAFLWYKHIFKDEIVDGRDGVLLM
ncbi:uncharacterized protein LOC110907879 [Helianthus annuus]|uniref:uncharacterized protein LOC110907879 n=1 Tax=Helianthus annuus TaxID=4232 RepID=UPI000B8FF689|nr:uncharacterized protein LOC110907879 [Helianthus annuus]